MFDAEMLFYTAKIINKHIQIIYINTLNFITTHKLIEDETNKFATGFQENSRTLQICQNKVVKIPQKNRYSYYRLPEQHMTPAGK